MKDLQNTTISNEVRKVINDGSKPVYNRWELQIHANGKTYKPIYVEEVDSFRDFNGNFHEELTIVAVFNSGDVMHGIMPYNNKLEATVRKIPIAGAYSITKSNGQSIKGQRYNAYLYDAGSKLVESNMYGNNFPGVAARGELHTLKIQLVDLVIERLRSHRFSTVIKTSTGINSIRTILDSVTRSTSEQEGVTFQGVDIAPGASDRVLNQIVLGSNTPLIGPERSLPRIVNDAAGGIYPEGFSYYYQDRMWYIFPPFATRRFETSEKTLTVINVPANKYPSVERTYRRTATQLVVISTGEVKHRDYSLETQANQGNATRFIDANKIMGSFVKILNGQPVFDGKGNLSEFMVKPRDQGTNIITQSNDGGVSSSYGNEYSKLISRTGSYIQFTWENAMSTLIIPGMPVKFMYLIKDLPYEITGTVSSVQTREQPINTDLNNRVFGGTAVVTIYVDKVQEPPKRID